MTGAEGLAEMSANMMIATGILISTVVVLVAVGFVVYHRTVGDRHENGDGVRS